MSLSDDDKKRVGGSDAAAIAGVHPDKTALDVYRRIIEGHELADSPVLRRGRLMEPVIRTMVSEDFRIQMLGPRRLRSSRREYLRANLDDVGLDSNGEEVQEFKSVSPWTAAQYGDGDDECPTQHIVQCQWYMGMSGIPRARLSALIGVDDLRTYRLRADVEIQGMVLESVDRFWKDHVLPQRPPPLDASESTAAWLASRFPKPTGEMKAATAEIEQMVREFKLAQSDADFAAAHRDLIKNQLKELIGDARGIEGDGWRILWSEVKGREYTQWDLVVADLANMGGLAIEQADAVVKARTKRRAPYRTFRPSWAKEKSSHVE